MRKQIEELYDRIREDLAALAGASITESVRRESAERRADIAEARVSHLEAALVALGEDRLESWRAFEGAWQTAKADA